MDRGTWQGTVHGVAKSQTQLLESDKHTHTHTQWNTSQSIKKNKIMPFAATGTQLQIIIPSEVSQKEKDKYHIIFLICGI